jgi:hypothetical protein
MRKIAFACWLIGLIILAVLFWPTQSRVTTTRVDLVNLAEKNAEVDWQVQPGTQLMVTLTEPASLLPGKAGRIRLEVQAISTGDMPGIDYGYTARLAIPRQMVEPNGLTQTKAAAGRAAFHWNVVAAGEGNLSGNLWLFLLPGQDQEPVALLALPVELTAVNRLGLSRQGLTRAALVCGGLGGIFTAAAAFKRKRRNELNNGYDKIK